MRLDATVVKAAAKAEHPGPPDTGNHSAPLCTPARQDRVSKKTHGRHLDATADVHNQQQMTNSHSG